MTNRMNIIFAKRLLGIANDWAAADWAEGAGGNLYFHNFRPAPISPFPACDILSLDFESDTIFAHFYGQPSTTFPLLTTLAAIPTI
jgi:hypothetical protein